MSNATQFTLTECDYAASVSGQQPACSLILETDFGTQVEDATEWEHALLSNRVPKVGFGK